jgi:hypothetical protein
MDDQGDAGESQHDEWLANAVANLRSKNFRWSRYTQPSPEWDHDHCEFCFQRFAEPRANYNDSVEFGFTTPDRFNWVCRECVDKYKDQFGWIIVATEGPENC